MKYLFVFCSLILLLFMLMSFNITKLMLVEVMTNFYVWCGAILGCIYVNLKHREHISFIANHEFAHFLAAKTFCIEVNEMYASKNSGYVNTSYKYQWQRIIVAIAPFIICFRLPFLFLILFIFNIDHILNNKVLTILTIAIFISQVISIIKELLTKPDDLETMGIIPSLICIISINYMIVNFFFAKLMVDYSPSELSKNCFYQLAMLYYTIF